MGLKIYNATHTGATAITQLVNIETSNGGKTDSQVFPPGYFKIKFAPVGDPSSQHAKISLSATQGPESFSFDSSELEDKDGSTFASLQAARIYLLGFFFEPAALAKANSIQTQIDNGEIGGGAAYTNDVAPANDNVSTIRIIPSLSTVTTEAGDGNGPYITGFTDQVRNKVCTVGNNDNSSGDGFVVADGGSSFQKKGSGTAQLKFDTGKNNSTDKLLSPRYQPYWGMIVCTHEGTIGADIAKANAGGSYGAKKESSDGNLVLKVNEHQMLDLATWMVTQGSQSLDLSDMLGGVDWVAGQLYFIFWGRQLSGAVIGAVGLIPSTTLDRSLLAIRKVDGYNSQLKHADFGNWDFEFDEDEKVFEIAYGVGNWNDQLLEDFYRYSVSQYGSFA